MDLEDEVDYYDLIKAPQYLDFEELVRNNGLLEEADPADLFFATGNKEEVVIDYEVLRDEDEEDRTDLLSPNPKKYSHEEEEDVLSLIDASMAKYRSSETSDLSELSMTSMTQSQADESEQVQLSARERDATRAEELTEKLEKMTLSLDPMSKIIGELEQSISVSDVEIVEADEDEATQKPNLNMSLKEPLATPSEEGARTATNSSANEDKLPTGPSRQSAPKRPRSGSLPSLYKVGSPRLPKKAEIKVTIPKPFKLHETRTKPIVIQKEEPFQFKARRAPIKILHGGPTGLVTGHKPTVTCPMSPRFASEARIRERHIRTNTPLRAESPNENNRPISACSSTASLYETRSKIPRTFRAPSPIIRADKKVTVTQPFSFEERDKEMRRIRADKVRQELESETKVPEFHANPRPSFSRPKGVPKKKFVELTNVEPFHLKADQRGAMHQEAFRKKLEEEERKRQEQAMFHANPPTVIFKKPFEPEPSHKPLACPIDLQLNSDRRAQEREQYDNLLKKREEEEEELRKQAEAERLEYEKQVEVLKRKELVHKAIPLKAFRPFQVRSSARPLTTPQSPAFAPLPSQRRRNLQGPHQEGQNAKH